MVGALSLAASAAGRSGPPSPPPGGTGAPPLRRRSSGSATRPGSAPRRGGQGSARRNHPRQAKEKPPRPAWAMGRALSHRFGPPGRSGPPRRPQAGLAFRRCDDGPLPAQRRLRCPKSADGQSRRQTAEGSRAKRKAGPPSRRRRRIGTPARPGRAGITRLPAPGPSRVRAGAFLAGRAFSRRRAAGSPVPALAGALRQKQSPPPATLPSHRPSADGPPLLLPAHSQLLPRRV